MTIGAWMTLAVFVGVYLLLATEWVHRAVVALVAALLVVVLGLVPLSRVPAAIDWNTLGLLFGLMILVLLMESSGLFGVLASLLWRGAGASAAWLVTGLLVIIGVVSAFLPNLTVILVFGPMVLATADTVGLPPVPLLILAVAVSNLGGLATLIGDPPNLLIGTGANIGFAGFAAYAAPLAALLIVAVIVWTRMLLPIPRRRLPAVTGQEHTARPGLRRLLVVFLLTVTGFVAAGPLHLPLGLVGLAGGAGAVAITGADLRSLFTRVDWATLAFFAGLFTVVGSLETQGIIGLAARGLLSLSVGPALPLVVMTGVALLSAFVDNIPIVAAAIPMVDLITQHHPGFGLTLWFALAIGAAVGGNATLVGASANVVAAGLAKARGYSLSFGEYWRWGWPVAVLTWGLAAAYLWWMPAPH